MQQQNETVSLSKSKKVLIREDNIDQAELQLRREISDGEICKFCLLVGASPHNVAQIESTIYINKI